MKKIPVLLFNFLPFLIFSQTWTSLNSLPSQYDERNHPVTFSLNGEGYVLTGDSFEGEFKDFYKYDITTDSWEQLPDFPGNARGYSYGVTANNKAYVGFGGYFDPGEQIFTYLSDLWEYNPTTTTWTQLASLPGNGRIHPAMVAAGEKILVGLGGSSAGDLKDWWEYDIANDTWISKPDFPASRRHHPYYFDIDGIVYVGFGHHQATIFNDFYKYDPTTSTWSSLGTFPGQGRVAGTQFSYNGKGYILSGQGETHQNLPTGEFWEYDSVLDQWTELPPHPGGGRWAPGSFVIDDEVFLLSGRSNQGDQKDLMKYSFAPLGVDDNLVLNSIKVYPNPVQNSSKILAPETFVNLKITTLGGQQVESHVNKTSNGFEVDLSGLSAGVYIIQLETLDQKLAFRKIIKL